jgi:xanthine dehydrogenase YagR molybdenum-binding subunit
VLRERCPAVRVVKTHPRAALDARWQRPIGWGMATETYPGKNLPASALVRLQPNGRILVASGTQEIGTGNYTIMTEVAADVLRVSPSIIDSRLGDTSLPEAPISAGSMSTASVTPAVKAAAEQAKQKLIALALADRRGTLYGAASEDVDFQDGNVFVKSAPAKSESFVSLLSRNGNQPVGAVAKTVPQLDSQKAACHSFGAVFAEVRVDKDLGMTRVPRIVAVYDVGCLINRKTAQSHFVGGIVCGISLALYQDTQVDWRDGRITNANLADYRVPVNATLEELTFPPSTCPITNRIPSARVASEITPDKLLWHRPHRCPEVFEH